MEHFPETIKQIGEKSQMNNLASFVMVFLLLASISFSAIAINQNIRNQTAAIKEQTKMIDLQTRVLNPCDRDWAKCRHRRLDQESRS